MIAFLNSSELKQKYSNKDFFLVFLVLLTTVNPFFVSNKYVQLFTFILVSLNLFIKRKNLYLNITIINIFILYAILVTIQGIIWDFNLFSLFSSFILMYVYTYFLYKTYYFDLFELLENAIYYLTIISLTLYFSHLIIPSFGSILENIITFLKPLSADVERHSRSLIIYTYRPDNTTYLDIARNSGFAHEPGAFALLLNLAIVTNFLKTRVLISRRNILYIIAIITTFSTAGYLALFVLITLLIKNRGSRVFYVLVYIATSLAFGYYSIDSEFMVEKVSYQYEEQFNTSLDQQNSGRFMGIRKSLLVLSKYPLTGRGLTSASMPISSFDPEYASYGWFSYISKLGLIFGSIFIWFYIKGMRNWILFKTNSNLIFIIVTTSLFINLSSQTYIIKPFFLIFLFIGLFNNQMNLRLNGAK